LVPAGIGSGVTSTRGSAIRPHDAMTKTSPQFMSAFALSAAALFLGGCKDQPKTTDPDSTTTTDGTKTDSTTTDAGTTEGGDAAQLDPTETVKCFGINACSGQSQCNVNKPELGIEHACAGENACKGKGWIKVTRQECTDQKGEELT
jgi:hypothetical protein